MNYSKFRQKDNLPAILTIILGFLCITISQNVRADWRPDTKIEYSSHYESNLFHSHQDSLETADQRNDMEMDLRWNTKSSMRLEHNFLIDLDLELYADNSSRNRHSVSFQYAPEFEYHRRGKIKLEAQYLTGKKDLIDDNGEVLARTLGKDVIDLELTNYYRYRKLSTRQSITFSNYNYDESYDEFGKRMTSYDFHYIEFSSIAAYNITRRLEISLKAKTQKRNYEERKTLSLDKTSSLVRNYRLNSLEAGVEIEPYKWIKFDFESRFSRRTENFENFYGYDEWRHEIKVDIDPFRRHDTEISFVSRKKDYKHYFTSDTGILYTVFIDYVIFKLEHVFRLSSALSLKADIRTFNKISNDPDFDYNNTVGGLGFILKF